MILHIARLFIFLTSRFVSPLPVALEWVFVGLGAMITALAGSFICARTPAIPTFRRIANRKPLAIAICGLLPVAVRLAMLGFMPVPDPSIHDEFSHLLLGDTLAHGRLTNPTHPMWRHFESIHIIQRPTYNSMYPPVQGSFLALGQVLFHEPWGGVVISVGLMFAAMCWMMQGWLPPAWALAGTLVAILKFGIATFWINSYMGGSGPAIGGALLIGSLPRLKEKPRAAYAILFALGLVILMNSRPFEGAILGAGVAIYLSRHIALRNVLKTLIAPAAIVLTCGFLFTGFYNWKVTGNPLRMPYVVNRDTYGWPENLAFLPPKKVELKDTALKNMYLKEIHNRDAYTGIEPFLVSLDTRLFDNWTFFLGPILTVPLLFLPWIARNPRTRPLVMILLVVALLNLFQLVLYPYHLAPVVPVIFAVVAQGIRYLYVTLSRTHRLRGFCFAVILPVCLILTGVMKQEARELDLPLAYWEIAAEPQREPRAYIESWLAARPRPQLVIVRYDPNHNPNQEWVYNHADIDGSKVVWARDLGAASNARLLNYFPQREAWLLEADVYPPRVVHYELRK